MSKKHFLRGLFFGFIAGILAAPKPGREIRSDIHHVYDEMKDRIAKNHAGRSRNLSRRAEGRI
jgi:gas vesicle protein